VSRIGKNPVVIPTGVTVKLAGNRLTVKGPKGELTMAVATDVTVAVSAAEVTVTRPSDVKEHRALHGTTRANIANMVRGVVDGYKRNLEIVGVGYRAELRGGNLLMALGYSHQILFFPPTGVQIEVPTPTSISVTGIDKQLVGQVAAKIRSFRPPEPYKGKGVKYEGEFIRRKAGKTAKS
jgi:large subunit ribosomal protein L6